MAVEPNTALAVGSGLASIGGTLIGSSSAASEARKQRSWQEMMSNTAHQREVKDLRAAGLNPILSATGGAGSSTPSGGMAPGIDPNVGTNAMNSALSVIALQKDLGLANSQTKLQNAQAESSVQSAKESLAREQAMRQAMGIDADKYDFEKRYREMDKAFDYGSKGAGAISDVMSIFKGFKGNSAKSVTAPWQDKSTIDALKKLELK